MKIFITLLIAGIGFSNQYLNKMKMDNESHYVNISPSAQVMWRATIVDSSGNGYTLWTNMHESVSYSPTFDYLLIVNRGYLSTNVLNCHYAPGDLSFWISETPYYGELGGARYPTAFIESGWYLSFPAITGSENNWVIVSIDTIANLGNLYPRCLHKVITKKLPTGNLLSIGITIDTIYYKTVKPGLDSVLGEGVIASGCDYWGYDINGGIGYIFYRDTLIDTNVYYKTTVDGINWSAQQNWNLAFTPPYPSTKIFWTQMAVTDNGLPRLVFNTIDGNDNTYPYYGKVYVSYASGQPCIEVSSTFGAPDTECFYPTIATGGNMVAVLYCMPRNNEPDSLNWWDFYIAWSTDNGTTWGTPVNYTQSLTSRPGLPQLAKRIDTLRNRVYYVYAVDMVENHDPLWHLWFDPQGIDPMYICFDYANYVGIEETALRPALDAVRLEVYPNPFREKARIAYSVDRSNAKNEDLKIYDVSGRLVRDLSRFTNYDLRSTHVIWDGTDDSGHKLPAGVYFARLETAAKGVIMKMVKVE